MLFLELYNSLRCFCKREFLLEQRIAQVTMDLPYIAFAL